MFRNYCRIAWRQLQKSRAYSSLNIIGLATSLAACILMLLYVQDELSFDGFHRKGDRVYKVSEKFTLEGKDLVWDNSPAPVATFGKIDIPEVEDACRITEKWSVRKLEYNGKNFFETRLGQVDGSFFNLFSFPLVKGNAANVFPDDRSIVISESIAAKIFGNTDPMGRTIKADDKLDYHVSGVMKDMPKNSSIQFDILFSFAQLKRNYNGHDYWKSLDEDWGNYNYSTYLLLKPGADAGKVAGKLTAMHKRYRGEDDFTKTLHYLMQPLPMLHLTKADGSREMMMIVRLFFIVAVIILLIGCINYVNLVTARATKRAKEISLRKIIGAGKASLFGQFLGESVLLFGISLALATLLIWMAMPMYNYIAGKEIVFHPWDKNVLSVYGLTFAATLVLAGIYPAITLSSFKPMDAIRGKLAGFGNKGSFRKVLVVIQFTFSIMLIVGTLVINQQLQFIRQKNLGYDKDHVIMMNMGEAIANHYEAARTELEKQPGILGVTESGEDILNSGSSTGDADWDGKKPGRQFIIGQLAVEPNFLEVMHIKLAEGAGFTGTPADSTRYILNETAIREMGLKDPIGKRFTFHDKKGTIVGIVKDFHFTDMHEKIAPTLLFYNPGWRSKMYVRTTAKDASKAIAAATAVWKQYNPEYPFQYDFLDDAFDNLYKSDMRVGKLFNCFAGITILISCLGLFGLITYTAESKVKEIGVRKVLGANIAGIVKLLSGDFVKLIVIAAAIAFPLAWWGLSRFLQTYAYRISMSGWTFVLAGIIALFIALATISFQAVKAALANPAKSLRTE